MRNLKLVDAVIALHDIARTVEAEIGHGELSLSIHHAADQLHQYSILDDRANTIAHAVIDQAKE